MQSKLAAWLQHIAAIHPSTIDLGIDRITQVAKSLNLTTPTCKVITVAGTNGKGSTVAAIAAIAVANKLNVGCYTSPHLISYNERVKINNQDCSDEDFCQAFTAIENNRGNIPLTFFEYGTLAALYIFNQAKLDLIILEVGLGGRLDAVNCIAPDIAVITTIDLDHQTYLGNDKNFIGKEKAGIIRSGKPVVIGDSNCPSSVIDIANNLQAPIYQLGKTYNYTENNTTWTWQGQATISNLPKPNIHLNNAATAIQAYMLLETAGPAKKSLPWLKILYWIPAFAGMTQPRAVIPAQAGIQSNLKPKFQRHSCENRNPIKSSASSNLTTALTQITIPARQEHHPGSPNRIYDVAHNPQACSHLATALAQHPKPIHAIFSMLANKDIACSIAPLIPHISHWHLAELEQEHGASATELATALQQSGAEHIHQYSSLKAAYQQALSACPAQGTIVAFGSFHVITALAESGCYPNIALKQTDIELS